MSWNGSDTTDDKRTPATPSRVFDRRSYLSAVAGSVGTVVSVSGLATADEGDANEELDDDEMVVNAVDDLDCDPTGNEPVQNVITNAVAAGTSIQFPAGQYLIDGQIVIEGVDDVELTGADGAEFVVGNYYGPIVHVRDSSGFRLDGLDVNQEETNNAGNINVIADDWEISNVTIYGDERNPQSGANGDHKFNVHVASSDSTGRIRNCEVRGYTDMDRYRDVTGGIRAGPSHYGTLYVENTYVEGRGNNSSYTSRTNGPVIYRNCHHRNSRGAQFRIGHPESRVENCIAVLNEREIPDWVDLSSGNWRGLRAESDDRFSHGHAGLQFVDTDVVVEYADDFSVHSGIQIQRRWGGATIEGCRIQMDTNSNAITMNSVDWSEVSSSDTAVTVRDTVVTGDSAIYVGAGRDGTVIEDSRFDESNVVANSEISIS